MKLERGKSVEISETRNGKTVCVLVNWNDPINFNFPEFTVERDGNRVFSGSLETVEQFLNERFSDNCSTATA
jgi:hypothetical protein